VIQPAVADVISPSIAAHDPHTFLHQQVGEGAQLLCFRRSIALQSLLEKADALPLLVDVGFVLLRSRENGRGQFVPDLSTQLQHQFASEFGLLIDREPESESELGVVFKQGIGPRRPAAARSGW